MGREGRSDPDGGAAFCSGWFPPTSGIVGEEELLTEASGCALGAGEGELLRPRGGAGRQGQAQGQGRARQFGDKELMGGGGCCGDIIWQRCLEWIC